MAAARAPPPALSALVSRAPCDPHSDPKLDTHQSLSPFHSRHLSHSIDRHCSADARKKAKKRPRGSQSFAGDPPHRRKDHPPPPPPAIVRPPPRSKHSINHVPVQDDLHPGGGRHGARPHARPPRRGRPTRRRARARTRLPRRRQGGAPALPGLDQGRLRRAPRRRGRRARRRGREPRGQDRRGAGVRAGAGRVRDDGGARPQGGRRGGSDRGHARGRCCRRRQCCSSSRRGRAARAPGQGRGQGGDPGGPRESRAGHPRGRVGHPVALLLLFGFFLRSAAAFILPPRFLPFLSRLTRTKCSPETHTPPKTKKTGRAPRC